MARKRFAHELSKIYSRGHAIDADSVLLADVCDTVFYTHFSGYHAIRDELIQEGLLYLLQRIHDNTFDPSKGDAYNFAYTVIMNAMQNYTYHNVQKYASRKNSDLEDFDYPLLGTDLTEEAIIDMREFVNDLFSQHTIDPVVFQLVKAYFYDKLGIHYTQYDIVDTDNEGIRAYKHYVNLIEVELIKKFVTPEVYTTNIKSILDVLESEGAIDKYMRAFLDTLTDAQCRQFMYVYSGETFTFPSKSRILRTDVYLNIYKMVKFRNYSVNKVAAVLNKRSTAIQAIVDKYDIIFS